MNDLNCDFTPLQLGDRSFRMAIGREMSVANDPVAVSYRAGHLTHLQTLLEVAGAALAPGDTVLDLGAHLGGFALGAAATGCRVLAVEASPRNAELVRHSAAANGFSDLHVVAAAIDSRPGTVEFSCYGPCGHRATASTNLPTISVPAVTIDDELARLRWKSVAFVKLDVEGSEVAALLGMRRLLGRRNAPLLFVESNSHTLGFYGLTTADLKRTLRQFGYRLYAADAGTLRPVAPDAEQAEVVVDYLAAKRLPKSLKARVVPPPPSWPRRVKRRVGRTLLAVGLR